MPNWCTNRLEITGPPEELKRLRVAAHSKVGSDFSLHELLPIPASLSGMPSGRDEKLYNRCRYRHNKALYLWKLEHWGIKWDLSSVVVVQELPSLVVEFSSPWTAPESGFLRISGMYPELEFDLEYFEPGMGFCGRTHFHNGSFRVEEYAEDIASSADIPDACEFARSIRSSWDRVDKGEKVETL